MYKYIHPGTIKQGYLIKSPPLEKRGLKNWKKRWCIFSRANGEEPCLNYYRTEEDAFSSLPIKRVNLKHCFKVEMDLAHSNHKNIFAVHMPSRVYYFSAPSQIEMSEWADTLCSHLNLSSTSVAEYPMSHTLPAGGRYGDLGKASSTLPAESFYASGPNRPLPKLPASPLPPLPNERSSPLPPLPNERSTNASPLPPLPNERSTNASPHPPLPNERIANPSLSRSPRLPTSPTHISAPPVPSHSPHPGSLSPHPASPNQSPFLHPSHTPPPPPISQSPRIPSHTSPLLSSRRSHGAPPPIPLPRPHSPSDTNTRQPNSAGTSDSISRRPPAPPPKAPAENPDSDDSDDLLEAPPTPPPRPRDKAVTLSPTSESTSSSDSETEPPPPLPPRPNSQM